MVDSNVDALALLKEEMSTEEIHLKVNAIHRLKTVILSIGEGNMQELIVYLNSKLTNNLIQPTFARFITDN